MNLTGGMWGDMKLFVDDIRDIPDERWTLARTVSEAVRLLVKYSFEEISLDHDISHKVTVSNISRPYPCDEDFSCLCYVIGLIYKGKEEQPRIVLHTSNYDGAVRMKSILNDYGLESTTNLSLPVDKEDKVWETKKSSYQE